MNQLLNFIANFLILVGSVTFYIILFSNIGKGYKAVEKFPVTGHWLVKSGLAFTATGAFLNLVTLSHPPFTEVIKNFGVGGLFVWAALYHAKKFGVTSVPQKPRRRWND